MQIQGETFKVQAERKGDLGNLGRPERLPQSLFSAKSLEKYSRVPLRGVCVSRLEKVFTGEEAFSISPSKIRSGNFLSSSKLLPKGIFNPFRKLRPKNWHLNTGDRILFGEGKKFFKLGRCQILFSSRKDNTIPTFPEGKSHNSFSDFSAPSRILTLPSKDQM